MKVIITIILVTFFGYFLFANVSVCSWNLQNFGQSKTDSEIEFIAKTVAEYDMIAIEEVVAGYGGPQAVARLSEALNRKGFKWDYAISDATISSSYKTERYAFLWKTSKVTKMGDAWLEKNTIWRSTENPFGELSAQMGKSLPW